MHKPNTNTSHRTLGLKQYELSNHLGNCTSPYHLRKRMIRNSHPVRNETGVLSVITDIKLPVLAEDGTTIISYTAVVVSATDYSAFGVALYGRTWSSDSYRYGFNGKEKDSETTAGAYDFGARIYDGRLGRWLSVDPFFGLSTDLTPYHSFSCDPINRIDPDGRADFYTKDGQHSGNDANNDNIAYVVNSDIVEKFTKEGVTDWTKVISDPTTQKLSVTNTVLTDMASTVADESSGDKIESYAIGSAIVNATSGNNDIITFLKQHTSGYNSKKGYSKLPENSEFCMEACINALTGGIDYSNGATRWDGKDVLLFDSPYRYKKAAFDDRKGIFIPEDLVDDVASWQLNHMINYASKALANKNPGASNYWCTAKKVWDNQMTMLSNVNRKGSLWEVTGVHGFSVFYKELQIGAEDAVSHHYHLRQDASPNVVETFDQILRCK